MPLAAISENWEFLFLLFVVGCFFLFLFLFFLARNNPAAEAEEAF